MTDLAQTTPVLVRDALPHALQPSFPKLVAALQVPDLASWPEGETIQEATQYGGLSALLIDTLHPQLRSARFAYLYRETLERGGEIKLATVSKASAKVRFLTDLDFIVDVNWTAWRQLSGPQRLALVDHELCHCDRDENGRAVLIPHDVEEFGAIITRWGLWQPNLVRFAQAMRQLDLFSGPQP
jgi:hypothetical protein